MAVLVTTGAVIVPAEKVEAVEVLLKPSKDADLDMLVSRLNRSCAVLLVLSVLRAGSMEGMFAFLAAVSVLCCSLPGARGVAISARFAKVYAFVAAVLAVHSCAVPMVALVHGVPMEVVEEVQLRCESMDPALAESLMGWAHNATQAWHERFHKEEDGPFSHGGIGHGPGHGHNDERLHEVPSVMNGTDPTTRCAKLSRGFKQARLDGSLPRPSSPRGAALGLASPLGAAPTRACRGGSTRRDTAADTRYSTHSHTPDAAYRRHAAHRPTAAPQMAALSLTLPCSDLPGTWPRSSS